MERRALVVALALTFPLSLYGIPYAYAAMTVTPYTNNTSKVSESGSALAIAACNTGDVATGGGWGDKETGTSSTIVNVGALVSKPIISASDFGSPSSGQPAAAWETFLYAGSSTISFTLTTYVICITPITVAGIGVPEFGSFYVAIALGAVVYFMLSRHFTRRPTISSANSEA